jgi:hypothetical protein
MPNWSPEGPQGLSGALDPNALEETSSKLWIEFLCGYFDGGQHGLIGYPQASLVFQQNAWPQPLNGVAIRMVGNIPSATKPQRDGAGNWVLDQPMSWTAIVAAKVTTARPDGQNSESLCRITSDLLYALFSKYDRLMPMARANLMRLAAKPPVLAPSVEFSSRKIMITGRVRVIVGEQYTSLLVGDAELLIGGNGEVLRVG